MQRRFAGGGGGTHKTALMSGGAQSRGAKLKARATTKIATNHLQFLFAFCSPIFCEILPGAEFIYIFGVWVESLVGEAGVKGAGAGSRKSGTLVCVRSHECVRMSGHKGI